MEDNAAKKTKQKTKNKLLSNHVMTELAKVRKYESAYVKKKKLIVFLFLKSVIIFEYHTKKKKTQKVDVSLCRTVWFAKGVGGNLNGTFRKLLIWLKVEKKYWKYQNNMETLLHQKDSESTHCSVLVCIQPCKGGGKKNAN